MLISSKVDKVMCENKQIEGHTPICIVFIHSVFREPGDDRALTNSQCNLNYYGSGIRICLLLGRLWSPD